MTEAEGGPYRGFNLALHVGDDSARVAAHRRRLAEVLGIAPGAAGSATGRARAGIAWMNQVHSTRIAAAQVGAAPTADALLLDTRNAVAPSGADMAPAAAAVLVADCLPVLLASGDGRVVAAVHAGRRGLLDGIIPAVLTAMDAQGVPLDGVRAAIGPAICGACYEVPEDLRDAAAAVEPACAVVTRWGTPGIDLAAGATAQLERAGVGRIVAAHRCTYEHDDLYSYRRDGTTGRQAGVVLPAAP
ncbi:polyphenol oxidase family protein [Actinomyces procaprae]|uniref:polyphenol oxidase family protein n=1 Tax=Actinomyces procaprae TaxID=2560010 RepID=UPI00109DC04F|nr:polyphenol oxidase family protein [Actinomyces procaprae]